MVEGAIKNHKLAAERLDLVKDRAFSFIKNNLGKVSEYDVNKFIFSEFKKSGFTPDRNYPAVIVAVNENAQNPHYFPNKKGSKIIKKNDLILLDIWANLKGEDSHFADITWMAYAGREIPGEIKATFERVIGARDFTVKFIKKILGRKQLPNTQIVDRAVRKYFGKMGKYFIHGTGHSLGIKECHGKYFRFDKRSNAKMKIGIPFTIEPGLYFPGKFGIRSEINCYITKNYKLEITTKVQKQIIKI
ncbi:MAG: M24 family metallopeptidase [Candidatus Pacebacteria bacterium]|nr:M24 family metallopeptidase [Candidatus Paceibacterota bacterium]